MVSKEQVREALTGPIASLPTLFNRDGSIDFDGLRNFVDFVIAGSTKTVLLTHGDSLYTLLSDAEIAEVTRVVAEHAAGRAMVVAADGIWATPQEVEFAQYARDVGADMLMVLPPDWATSCNLETFVAHYEAVAEHIPVMVVTNLYMNRQELGLEVIETLRDRVPGVMAVKDDVCGTFARQLSLLVHDHWAVFSGGQKQNHLNMVPYGCDGYMSTYIKFAPSISQAYWTAFQAGDDTRVREIVRDYDLPFFRFVRQSPGGFNAGLHGTLELFRVAQRWRRKPYYSLNDAEMEHLADFFRQKSLL